MFNFRLAHPQYPSSPPKRTDLNLYRMPSAFRPAQPEHRPTSRRQFLRITSLGAVAVLAAAPAQAAWDRINALEYREQLALIRAIEAHCTQQLNMQLSHSFYQSWELLDSYMYYLYVSHPDRVEVPEGLLPFYYFGADRVRARRAAESYQAKGYETLVYQTAGTSATRLSRALMSYSLEAIALIVFHEALHVDIREREISIPIAIEEAAADVMAHYATVAFQRQTPTLQRRPIRQRIRTMERIYKAVNKATEEAQNWDNTSQELTLNRCYKRIKRALRSANAYQVQRFNYPINTAYLLRNSYYSQYYFDLDGLYKALDSDLNAFLQFVYKLPNDLDAALFMIRNHKYIS